MLRVLREAGGAAAADAHAVVAAELAARRTSPTFVDRFSVPVYLPAENWSAMSTEGRGDALRRLHLLQLRSFYDSWLFRLERVILGLAGYRSSSAAIAASGFVIGDRVAVFAVSRTSGRGENGGPAWTPHGSIETMLEWWQGTSYHALSLLGGDAAASARAGVTVQLTFGSTLHESGGADDGGDGRSTKRRDASVSPASTLRDGESGSGSGSLPATLSRGIVGRALTAAHSAYSRLLLAAAARKLQRAVEAGEWVLPPPPPASAEPATPRLA